MNDETSARRRQPTRLVNSLIRLLSPRSSQRARSALNATIHRSTSFDDAEQQPTDGRLPNAIASDLPAEFNMSNENLNDPNLERHEQEDDAQFMGRLVQYLQQQNTLLNQQASQINDLSSRLNAWNSQDQRLESLSSQLDSLKAQFPVATSANHATLSTSLENASTPSRTFGTGATSLNGMASYHRLYPFRFPADIDNLARSLTAWENRFPPNTNSDVPLTLLRQAFDDWPHAGIVRQRYATIDTVDYPNLRSLLLKAVGKDHFKTLTQPGKASLAEVFQAAVNVFKDDLSVERVLSAMKDRITLDDYAALQLATSWAQFVQIVQHRIQPSKHKFRPIYQVQLPHRPW